MFDYYQSIGCLLYLYGYVINLHMVNFQIKIGFLYGRCFMIIYSLIFKYMFQFWAEGCLFMGTQVVIEMDYTPNGLGTGLI